MGEVDTSDAAVLRQIRVLDSASGSAQERVRALDALAAMGKARQATLADPVPLVRCLRKLMVSKALYTRCAALRVLRHFAHDVGFQHRCWAARIDWFVARSMDRAVERDKKVERERNLAYSLVARLVQLRRAEHARDAEHREGRLRESEPASPAVPPAYGASSVGSVMGGSPARGIVMGGGMSGVSGVRDMSGVSIGSVGAGLTGSPSPLTAEPPATPPTPPPVPPEERQPQLPGGVVMRLVAAAENGEDPYQRRSVLLLRDLLVAAPRTVADANAVRALLSAACDETLADLHHGIAHALLYTLDYAESRQYIRLQLDLQPLLAPFSEKIGKETSELKKRLRCAKDTVQIFLRSWVGLLALASDPRGLSPLIDTLRLPGKTWRKMAIFEIFHTCIRGAAPQRGVPSAGPWTDYAEDADGKRREEPPLTAGSGGHADPLGAPSRDDAGDAADPGADGAGAGGDTRRQLQASICAGHKALDVFLGSLLLVLDRCGLTETLIYLVRLGMGGDDAPDAATDPDAVLVSQAAAQLLQTFLLLTDSVFPRRSTLQLYDSFDDTIACLLSGREGKEAAASGEAAVSKVRHMTTSLFHKIAYAPGTRGSVRSDSNLSVRRQIASHMDDTQFRVAVQDSQVTATKDWNRWNCEMILFLIRGPLRLHSRLQEVLKTKFFKRLLSFLKPRKKLFSDMPYKEENLVYSEVACGVIELLLETKEGTKYLADSGLLEELWQILNEVTVANIPKQEQVLCKERIMYFMAREYFKIIGKFSESPSGTELLVQYKIFSSLQTLMEKSKSKDRDDICHQILKHLNFGRVGSQPVNPEARAIFAKAMMEGSRPIRLFATLQLRNSFRLGYKDSVDWALDLLVAQLADSWREVAKGAYEIINEWCALDDDVLDQFIAKRPGLQTFTRREESEDHAQRLLLRMLTRPSGFAYLHELGVVQRQVHEWRHGKATEWALGVERAVAKAVAPPAKGAPTRRAARLRSLRRTSTASCAGRSRGARTCASRGCGRS